MRRVIPLAVFLLAALPLAAAEEEGQKVYTMPEFRIESLDGTWLDSEELRGNVVLVDLWGTWCAPCIAVAPALDRLYADFAPRGLVMIGIAVDSGTDEQVAAAVEEIGISYPVALWNQHLAERIKGLESVPTYILIKPDWTIQKLWVGVTPPSRIRRELELLLPESPKASR